ncbi:MAG: hypothetical protein LBU11_08345 [Zoogloeaceae bacterium]|jgi:hypothetical protein|nr:hypothetical protein [Zoogloeaceae bacterium]
MKHVRLGPFLGVNNRNPDTQLGSEDTRAWLKRAVNVDVTNAGALKRRMGYRRALAATDAHSLWSDGERAFYVDGRTLCRLEGDARSPRSVVARAGLALGKPMSFASFGEDIYYSNGAQLGRLEAGSEDAPVWPERLAWEPEIRVTADGALGKGLYQVMCTRADEAGRESVPCRANQAVVPEKGKITLTLLEAARVYLTPANGDEFYSHGLFPAGAVEIALAQDGGGRCFTRRLAPMPPGEIVRAAFGRLLIASGNTLFFSEPYLPGLYDPARGSIRFSRQITLLEPCGDGIYISADQTRWLSGDIAADAALRVVHPLPAYARSGQHLPDTEEVVWYSDLGLVKGDASGKAEFLQAGQIATKKGGAAAILYRRQDGLKQLVAAIDDAKRTVAGVRATMSAELVRGTTP